MGNDTEIRQTGEGLYRALIECSRDIHTVLNRDGIIVYQSPSVTQVVGWTPEELLGSEGLSYVHPDDFERIAADLAALISGNDKLRRSRLRFRTKDDTWVHLDSIARDELSNPEIRGLVIVSRDVSAEVEAERALKEREHLLRTVESHPYLLLWALDNKGVITVSEGSGLAVLGFSPGQTVGLSVFDMYADNPNVVALMRRALSGETLDYTIDMPSRMGTRTMDTRLRPQFSEDGTVVGVTAITFDVSDRVELEDELRRAKTMEAIGMLAGGIAHDFNNLLTAIIGFTAAAKRADSPARETYLDQVLEAGQRGAHIVSQLLSFARKDEVRPETIGLTKLLEGARSLYGQVLGEDINLEFDNASETECYIKIDRSKLEQVFLNLVTNARDAMPNGGTLRFSLSRHRTEGGERFVTIAVEDNGIGMSPETVECAFEPFYSTKERGTGLGLATTHGIVTRAGGQILLNSTLGSGTSFTLRFPCVEVIPAEASEPEKAPPRAGPGRVLLIEDDPAVLYATALNLEYSGYHVRTAESGQQGYEAFTKNRSEIDVVVTDMTMPGMKGDELAVRIREIDNHVPIVCVSGHHETSQLLDDLEGITLLNKPYVGDVLNEAIAAVLGVAESVAPTLEAPKDGKS